MCVKLRLSAIENLSGIYGARRGWRCLATYENMREFLLMIAKLGSPN